VEQRDLTITDYQALAEFRYQIRRFLHFSEEAARSDGVNPQHHQLLLALKGIPDNVEPTITHLAERLHLRHHSAVELTNRLMARGLIRKREHKEDRRRVLLEITPRGERVLRNLSLIHTAQLESVGAELIGSLQKIVRVNEGRNEESRSRKSHNKRTR
jgi:DNA-binding MarR family transcriptional regulator